MPFLGDLFGGGKSSSSPSAPAAPPSPSSTTAGQAGAATVADQRAAMLLAGGSTDYTGGLGVLLGSDVSTAKTEGA